MPLPKEKTKVKDNLGEYSMLLYGASKIGKCLAGSTWMVDPETMELTTLKNVIEYGKRVFCRNSKNQLIEAVFSNYSINKPEQLYKITTQSGKCIEATANHPFLTKVGGPLECYWVELQKLRVGDSVAVVTNYDERFGIDTIEQEDLEDIPEVLPDYFFSATKESLVKLLKKMVRLTNNTYYFLTKDTTRFQHLLTRFGIRSQIDYMYLAEDGNKSCVVVKHQEDINTLLSLILPGNKPMASAPTISYEKILLIKKTGVEPTYDIEIPELHNFIANDFVVHNSTFASKFPDAVFLATERGLNSLEVFSEMVTSWDSFKKLIDELAAGKHNFKTVVIDTVDNLFRLCSEYVCEKLKIKHESDAPYGKGFGMVNSEFHRALHRLSLLPYGLILISHSKEKEIETRTGKVKKIIPTLPDAARAIVLGLVDMIIYAETIPIKDAEGKKIIGTKRVLRTKPNTLFEAGDRTERLPETFDFSYELFVQNFKSGKKEIAENLDDE